MLTYSGLHVEIDNPRVELITLRDIAHALAMQCRFNGQCREFYSVAQHSVLVADLVADFVGGDGKMQLAALLHDAAEAYLGDAITPLKAIAPEYRKLEDKWLVAIYNRFGIPTGYRDNKAIKHADLAALMIERRELLPADPLQWPLCQGVEVPQRGLPKPHYGYSPHTGAWGPLHAEELFMSRLTAACNNALEAS